MAKSLNDGTPYTLKGVRTVWSGGKARDNFKGLPIRIADRTGRNHWPGLWRRKCEGAYLREILGKRTGKIGGQTFK